MRFCLVPLLCSWLGCAAGLKEVPRGPHPPSGGTMPFVVDSEPPPAAIEHVRNAPAAHCLWQDGSWTFLREEWVWQPGQWVEPNADCYLAEASLVWVAAVNQPGALFFTPRGWYSRSTGTPCPAPETCRAR